MITTRLGFKLSLLAFVFVQVVNGASLKNRQEPDSKTTLEFVPVQVIYSDDVDETLLEGRGRNLEEEGPPGDPEVVVQDDPSVQSGPEPPQDDEVDDDDDDDDEDEEEDDEDNEEKDDEDEEDDADDKEDAEKGPSPPSKNNKEKPPKKALSSQVGLKGKPDADDDIVIGQQREYPSFPIPPGLEELHNSPGDISEGRYLINGGHSWGGYGSGIGYGGLGHGNGLLGSFFNGGGHGHSHHHHGHVHGYGHGFGHTHGHGYHGHPTTYHNGFYTTIE